MPYTSSPPTRRYHLLAWVFPLFVASVPLMAGKYGPADQWCWIVDDWKWRFFVFVLNTSHCDLAVDLPTVINTIIHT